MPAETRMYIGYFHVTVESIEVAEILVAQVAEKPVLLSRFFFLSFSFPLLSLTPFYTYGKTTCIRVRRGAHVSANKFISRGDLY